MIIGAVVSVAYLRGIVMPLRPEKNQDHRKLWKLGLVSLCESISGDRNGPLLWTPKYYYVIGPEMALNQSSHAGSLSLPYTLRLISRYLLDQINITDNCSQSSRVWNKLPTHISSALSLPVFLRHPKRYFSLMPTLVSLHQPSKLNVSCRPPNSFQPSAYD